jgi:hypothetical protein
VSGRPSSTASPWPWRAVFTLASVLALGFLVASPANAQPDLRQMNGLALPSADLPDGTVSVRVVRQTLGNNVVGASVSIAGNGVSDTAPTDESGRAIFSGLTPGTMIVATVTVDGETVRSQPIQVAPTGGMRTILAVGLEGGTAGGSAPAPSGPGAAPPAVAATPGTVVLGAQTRHIVDFNNEMLEVLHVFEFANAASSPVSVAQPVTIAMPADAQQVTLLDGSAPTARVFQQSLVVAGPFASGRTMAQVVYRLPISGARREIALTLPVASMATNIIVRRLGTTHLAEPTLPQSREAEAEGRKYFTGTGPGLPPGGTLRMVIDGIPHHPVWPRYTALGLAALIALAGLWLVVRVPVDASARLKELDAQRGALLARLQRVERDGEPVSEELHEERDGLLRDLEGVYALIDAERARADGHAAPERRAS